MRTKLLLLLACLGLLGGLTLGVSAANADDKNPATCASNCGAINYTEYGRIDVGDSKGSIENMADAYPTFVDKQQNGTFLVTIYNANNDTWAWDIRQVQLGFSWNANVNRWQLEYKGRIGCPKTSCGGSSTQLIVP